MINLYSPFTTAIAIECYCFSRACLNKLINTYLSHWPLISTTMPKAAFDVLCFKQFSSRTSTNVLCWCYTATGSQACLKNSFFDIQFCAVCCPLCLAYSTSILSELVTRNDTHEFIIISICRFLEESNEEILYFHYLQIYDVFNRWKNTFCLFYERNRKRKMRIRIKIKL